MTLKHGSVYLPPRKRFKTVKHDDGTEIQTDIRELAIYTGEKQEIIVDKLLRCRTAIADEWREKNPVGPDEAYDFYFNTSWYLYDLWSWTHDDQTWEVLDKITKPGTRVLDYGCGIGDISIYLAEKGCNVTAVDLVSKDGLDNPCKTFHFAQWRSAMRMLNTPSPRGEDGKIKFRFDPNVEKFDVVLAIDVLEHVHFPLRFAVQLGDLLKSRESVLFVTPSFADSSPDKHYPMHLEENRWLREPVFSKVMLALAFAPELVHDEYYPAWHPVYRPPATQAGGSGSVSPAPSGSSGSSDSSPDSPSLK